MTTVDPFGGKTASLSGFGLTVQFACGIVGHATLNLLSFWKEWSLSHGFWITWCNLPERDRKMLAMRIGERSNIMVLEAQAHGPEGKRLDDMEFSPAIQLGSFNAGSYRDEDELAAWYAQVRLPRSMAPGCVRVRKLVSVSGWAKHACLYEYPSMEARTAIYADHASMNPETEAWTDKVVRKLVHAPGSPNVARRIWPSAI